MSEPKLEGVNLSYMRSPEKMRFSVTGNLILPTLRYEDSVFALLNIPSSCNKQDSNRLHSFQSALSLDSTHSARICEESPQILEFGKNCIYSTG